MKRINIDNGQIRYEELTADEYALGIGIATNLGCGIEYGTHIHGLPNFNIVLFPENRTEQMVTDFEAALAAG